MGGVGVCGAGGGNGLPVSKPSGDSAQFDYVVGHPGKFVAVQVKCTIAKQHNAKGYICNLKSNNVKYEAGSFDFVAAYAILGRHVVHRSGEGGPRDGSD